jgi:hypothetical protein
MSELIAMFAAALEDGYLLDGATSRPLLAVPTLA